MTTEDDQGKQVPDNKIVSMDDMVPGMDIERGIRVFKRKAIEAFRGSNHIEITGFFDNKTPEHAGNVAKIPSKQPYKWDDTDFRNQLIKSINQLKDSDDPVEKALHQTLNKMLDLHNKATDGRFPWIQTAITRSYSNFYNEILKFRKGEDAPKTKENPDIVTARINYIKSGESIIESLKNKFDTLTPENTVTEINQAIMPLTDNLHQVYLQIKHRASSLGITAAANHLR